MPIRTIEIICIPCEKCEWAKRVIQEVIKGLELQNKTKIIYEFKHTIKIADITKYSLNPSQAPAILVNGNVEYAGRVEPLALKKRLETLHRGA